MSLLRPAARIGRKFQNPVPTELGGLSVILKVLPLYLTSKAERFPRTPPGPFRTNVSVYDRAPASGLRITWFGHSSTLLELDGVRILIDPVWDERASPVQWFGPKRFFAPTLSVEELPVLDAVIQSHDHYDHLGETTVRRLSRLQPNLRWITSLEVGPILQKFGVAASQITELNWTESTEVRSAASKAVCRITSVPSRHFSGRSLGNRLETLWASFVLRGGDHTVYYGADSGAWSGFEEIGKTYGPFDLTLLEIGAFNQLWEEIHLGPEGAAKAFQALGGTGLLMPVHWGLFDLALHGWREPIQQMEQLAAELGLQLWYPTPGQPMDFHRGEPLRSPWWEPAE
jgi:L-ascorbate metabolism protein UlaG (beta-lactamase superfamily)